MRRARLLLATALLAALLSPAPAWAVGGGVFSVTKCRWSHTAPDDPIVHPGTPGASHSHDFYASRTTNAHSTYEEMVASDTSCPLSADTAGYWQPTLLRPDGTALRPVQTNAYYRSPSGVRVEAFPPDLRIVAGGDTENPPRPGMVQRSLSWSCKDSGPFSTSPPDCRGISRFVTAHVHFPNCSDGRLDSPDHRSHLAYGGKSCPASHPIRLPKLALHFRWLSSDVGSGAGLRLSSDPDGWAGGRSLHADFWNTWDQDALAFLVERCLNAGRSCKGMTDGKLADLGF